MAILKYIKYLDHSFITSDPNFLKLNNKYNCSFMPIPVDENIEYLKCYENPSPIKDLFFTMSHGVNKGVLRKNKIDVREPFVRKLMELNPNIVFDIYGYKNIRRRIMQASHLLTNDITSCTCTPLDSRIGRDESLRGEYERVYYDTKNYQI